MTDKNNELTEEDNSKASDLNALLCFDDALILAKGCFDYKGGYHDKKELGIYWHGSQTVINVLENARGKGLRDFQVAAVYAIGKEA